MANPIHDLQDRLHKLKEIRGLLENSIKIETERLVRTKSDISIFENAINLIKKGE